MTIEEQIQRDYEAAMKMSSKEDEIEKDYQEALRISTRPYAAQRVGIAIKNTPRSAGKLGMGLLSAARHPIDTGYQLGKLGVGGIIQADAALAGLQGPGAKEQRLNMYRNAPGKLGGMLGRSADMAADIGKDKYNKYRTIDSALDAFQEDPFEVLGDLSMLAGGAGTLAKAGKLTKTANAFNKVAQVTDPVSLSFGGAGKLAKKSGAGAVGRMVRDYLHPKDAALVKLTHNRLGETAGHLENFTEDIPGFGSTAGQALVGSPFGTSEILNAGEDVKRYAPDAYIMRDKLQRRKLVNLTRGDATPQAIANAEERANKMANFEYGNVGPESVPIDDKMLDFLKSKSMRKTINKIEDIGSETAAQGGVPGSVKNAFTDALEAKALESDLVDILQNPRLPGGMRADVKRTLSQLRTQGYGSIPVNDLHMIKEGYNDILASKVAGGKSLAKFDRKSRLQTGKDFQRHIENQSENYRKVGEAYSERIGEVNRLKVRNAFAETLDPTFGASAEPLRSRAFEDAVRSPESVIKKSTSLSKSRPLESILNPKDLEDITKVRNQLQKEVALENEAGYAGGDGLPNSKHFGAPAFLNRAATIINKAIKEKGIKLSEDAAREMAIDFLSAQSTAKALRKVEAARAKTRATMGKVKASANAFFRTRTSKAGNLNNRDEEE